MRGKVSIVGCKGEREREKGRELVIFRIGEDIQSGFDIYVKVEEYDRDGLKRSKFETSRSVHPYGKYLLVDFPSLTVE